MSELLQTQEVGSLAKPDWRVAVVGDKPIGQGSYDALRAWSEEYGSNDASSYGQQVLESAQSEFASVGRYSDRTKETVRDLAAHYAVQLQEHAGLDIVYDGEQDRSEMYQHSIARTLGFAWRGRVRAFDTKSYKKAACIGEPSISEPWHSDEVTRLQRLTDKDIKVPITGAYTLAAWSYNEHYTQRADLVRALARNVIRPNIIALLEQGVSWIQIDEPAATTVPGEVPLFVESFNESVRGLVGRFSVHLCFSDYTLLVPHIEKLENCSQLSLEFANRDGHGLGTATSDRPAYEVLKDIVRYAPGTSIGLGVASVHEDTIETPELVRDRILRAVDIVGDPALIYPSPDCGLRTRSWPVASEKLLAVSHGTRLAREII
ncbi:MAG: hypothetical protein JWM81_1056 [Candidatus Saccharibacteria bacterium]|nr:hypothetical protein [Candidatus Saccharibacteria bacterium]